MVDEPINQEVVAANFEAYKNVIHSCSRCWHNHIPGNGIICRCTCHSPANPHTIASSTWEQIHAGLPGHMRKYDYDISRE